MKYLSIFLLAFLFITSCKKTPTTTPAPVVVPPPPPPPPPPPAPTASTLINLPMGWRYNATLSAGFPTGVQVYAFDSIFSNRNTKAFCLAYDSRVATIDFKPVMAATAQTPSQFFAQETGTVYGCINGGYFGGNQSFSLVQYNSIVTAANIKVLNRTYMGATTPYYPTRAAFGVSSTGAPSATWVYSIGSGNSNVYSYPAPSPNLLNNAPEAVPTATFPTGGAPWATVSAIGGSPMLVYNNAINVTANNELLDVNNTTSRPRSAIGYNANGIVLIVAVEGDNTTASRPGVNLAEMATFMQNLTCTNAINLDGGGSTSLVIKNQLTVRPGDAGGVERPVVSALIIKAR